MASSFMQKAGIKLFAKHIEQYTPQDPLYEEHTDERGRKKRKKVRLATPVLTLFSHLQSVMSLLDSPSGTRKS